MILVFEFYKDHSINKNIKINFNETIIINEESKELSKEYKEKLEEKLAYNRFNTKQGSSGRIKLWKNP